MKVVASVRLDTRKLDRLSSRAKALAEDVLDVAAYRVEARWKERIVEVGAVDTGAYVNSVHVTRDHKPLERVVADGVEYGIFVEGGTSRVAARPCAAPAVETEKVPLMKALGKIVG